MITFFFLKLFKAAKFKKKSPIKELWRRIRAIMYTLIFPVSKQSFLEDRARKREKSREGPSAFKREKAPKGIDMMSWFIERSVSFGR